MVGKSGVGSGTTQSEDKSAKAKHLLGEVRNNNRLLDGICKHGSRICIELALILTLRSAGEA